MKKSLRNFFIYLFVLIANVSWALMFISISYAWGYAQAAIDNHIAYFSAPTYLSLLNGLPWLLGTLVFGGLALLFIIKINRK